MNKIRNQTFIAIVFSDETLIGREAIIQNSMSLY